MKLNDIQCVDCLEGMAEMLDNTIDTVITDSPYGLGFMGKDWDHGVPDVTYWKEILRVAKPGAILLAFGGTRTHHKLTCAIEDAGWEIRDCLMWLHGQGFPKSLDVSKAIDRAEQWEGYGTALKPSYEPIILAMKPLEGTFAENAAKWGVAGLWIEGGRIVGAAGKGHWTHKRNHKSPSSWKHGSKDGVDFGQNNPASGRWPSNVLFSHHPDCIERGVKKVQVPSGYVSQEHEAKQGFTKGQVQQKFPPRYDPDGTETVEDWRCHEDCPVRLLDEMSGESKSTGGRTVKRKGGGNVGSGKTSELWVTPDDPGYGDTGGASRFFYCAKAPRSERFFFCDKCMYVYPSSEKEEHKHGSKLFKYCIYHPTQKPLKLMEYLCTLTKTPTGGVVFDPFAGTGSTCIAARNVGRQFLGMEIGLEYWMIADHRLEE